jgi:hypothetical protein
MQTLNNVPTEIEWRVYRGDTSRLTIQLKDNEGKTITNAEGFFCLARRYPNDPEVLAMMSGWFGTTPPAPNSNNQGDASTGILTIDIPWFQLDLQQDPFAWGKQFYFDVQLYINDSQVTILKVKVDVESDVSRNQGWNNGN